MIIIGTINIISRHLTQFHTTKLNYFRKHSKANDKLSYKQKWKKAQK